MIRASDLTVRRGTQVLVERAEFVIHPGERVGLVGRNGSGKSTLFALLQGQIDADTGNVLIPPSWQLASVAQSIEDPQRPAREYVIDGDAHLRELQHQRALVGSDETQGERIAELEMALDQAGAWQAASRAEALLAGLGFTNDQWDKPVGVFSGGWQMRIALARALMAPSDLLLLDEPTNHLDLDAMIWLERWLAAYDGTAIIISHDTEFLDAVCNVILHIDHRALHRYRGDYASFVSQRSERLRQTQIAWERQTAETARLERFIERFKAKATKAKQAQSRVKALARMQTLAPLHAEAAIDIRIPDPDSTPDVLLSLENASVGYQGEDGEPHVILNDVTCRIEAGDRIGVLGVNGAGKSTLIKLLAGELSPINGLRLPAKTLKIGYFAQQQMDMLDAQASPLLHLSRQAPQSNEQTLRNYLAQFGFTADRVHESIAPFSGGEKARLALALVVWDKPNLLILDEPSNHLDVETRQALTTALAQYDGSLLLVSHDRHLLRTTVDQFWLVASGQVGPFDGDLDDYRQQITSLKSSRDDNTAAIDDTVLVVDRKQQRRDQALARQRLAQQKKPLTQAVHRIEERLKPIQTRLDAMNSQIGDERFYQETSGETRQQVMLEHGQLSQEKEALELQWLELLQQIEDLERELSSGND